MEFIIGAAVLVLLVIVPLNFILRDYEGSVMSITDCFLEDYDVEYFTEQVGNTSSFEVHGWEKTLFISAKGSDLEECKRNMELNIQSYLLAQAALEEQEASHEDNRNA